VLRHENRVKNRGVNMKTCSILLFILCVGFSNLFSQPAGGKNVAGFYVLQDYDYFKTMLADIRRPAFHMRFYYDDAVRFSSLAVTGKHKFWDVSFGGFFPMLGYNFKVAPQPFGVAFFIEASAHMLLDFDTPSSDVINTDFRIGGGLAGRPLSQLKQLSLRYKFFHESTHIGDEYTLTAVADSAFRRYNVSYEAHELFVAFDHRARRPESLLDFVYLRLYAGGRRLNTGAFEDFKDKSALRSLKIKNKNESQLGGEFFLRGWLQPELEPDKINELVKRIIRPQYFMAAAEFYRRDQYAVAAPAKKWSYNVAAGLVYGNYFESKRTTKLLLNYYRGVNPHGQLRMYQISYLGVDFSVDF